MTTAGRPTKYKKEFVKQAEKLCRLGATDADLAEFFEVTVPTLNAWKWKYPEFFKSLTLGKAQPDNNVERSLYNRAVGYSTIETKVLSFNGEHTGNVDVVKHYPPDVNACKFWLMNRKPGEYRDKPDVESSDEEIVNVLKEIADKLPV